MPSKTRYAVQITHRLNTDTLEWTQHNRYWRFASQATLNQCIAAKPHSIYPVKARDIPAGEVVAECVGLAPLGMTGVKLVSGGITTRAQGDRHVAC